MRSLVVVILALSLTGCTFICPLLEGSAVAGLCRTAEEAPAPE